MKDIPMFTTEYGAAGLILREIPYQGEAYIRVHHSLEPLKLVEECVGFCRAVGAERVYASGDEALVAYPLRTAILRMSCLRENLGETEASVFPVNADTASRFQMIYNEKVRHVPNGAWMTDSDTQQMLQTGDGYFIHRAGSLLGIGRADGGEIRFLASCAPGAGADVVRALAHVVTEDKLTLQVASENRKAVALYERLGFVKTAELSRWYRVFPR